MYVHNLTVVVDITDIWRARKLFFFFCFRENRLIAFQGVQTYCASPSRFPIRVLILPSWYLLFDERTRSRTFLRGTRQTGYVCFLFFYQKRFRVFTSFYHLTGLEDLNKTCAYATAVADAWISATVTRTARELGFNIVIYLLNVLLQRLWILNVWNEIWIFMNTLHTRCIRCMSYVTTYRVKYDEIRKSWNLKFLQKL